MRDFHLNKLGMCSGITLDDLTMDKELGRGASSIVYMATHKTTGTKVCPPLCRHLELCRT